MDKTLQQEMLSFHCGSHHRVGGDLAERWRESLLCRLDLAFDAVTH